jgi:Flp pilus assembly protein protease CpaA
LGEEELMMPTLILLVSTFTDFKFKKVQNWIVLSLLAIVIVHHAVAGQREIWNEGFLGFGTAILLCLPLYMAKALGGGDFKIFAVFGLAANPNAVLCTFLFSLFWGSALGIAKAIFAGQGKVFLENFKKILKLQKPDPQTVQKIPYTIALLLGWFTFLIYTHYGRVL